MKKFLSNILSMSVLASTIAAAISLPVSANIQETSVPTIDNAAVVAKEKVNAHQSMRIEGDVYAGGQVTFDNASKNFLDGDIISAKEVAYQSKYSAILTEENRKGVDKVETDMSKYFLGYFDGEYLTDNAQAPEIPNVAGIKYKKEGWVSVNSWTSWPAAYPVDENGYPYYVISENTAFDGLMIQGAKLVIDTTKGPVYVKANQMQMQMANNIYAYLEVIGDNPAYIIAPPFDGFINVVYAGKNKFDFGTGELSWIVTPQQWGNQIGATASNAKIAANIYVSGNTSNVTFNAPMKGNIVLSSAKDVTFGNTSSLEGDIYSYGTGNLNFDGKLVGDMVTKASNIRIANSGQYNDERISGNINAINAKEFNIGCAVYGNIVTSASKLVITGGAKNKYIANVEGTVYAPNANVSIHATSDNGINRGQLICKSLDIFGEGAVVFGHAKNPDEENEPDPADVPTPTSDEEPVPLPEGEAIDLSGIGYAYIFGYEPEIKKIEVVNDEGNVETQLYADIHMAPDDAVTREQVASMIMRLLEQKYDTMNAEYPITDNIAKHAGKWYERGFAYLAAKGAFDNVASVGTGNITRGEVAKLVAFGLNLSNSVKTEFTDIADSEYKAYIEIMAANDLMCGRSSTLFEPERTMTRAEFCSMFNKITGRDKMELIAQDGRNVTPEIYSITDLGGHWAEQIMLKATSAYDEDGRIDITTRQKNIRNKLDKFDDQMIY